MKRPPIEGMPKRRPRCVGCNVKLKPTVRHAYERNPEAEGYGHKLVGRQWTGWSAYRGKFCTLRCALDFADDAHDAGYRRKFRRAG